MIQDRVAIHTTIYRECKAQLKEDAAKSCGYIGEEIDKAVIFYKYNKSVVDEYKMARSFFKELCKEELEDNFEAAKPLLKRMISEIKNKVQS